MQHIDIRDEVGKIEFMTTVPDQLTEPFRGKRVAFVGKMGGITKKEARQMVRDQGGVPVDGTDSDLDLIVIGADQLPLGDDAGLLNDATRRAAAGGSVEIISETELLERMGMVEEAHHSCVRRLYTPAMLADLLNVSVSVVRRWHRRGLIVPVREVRRLPYFDFQEVATARHLGQLLAAGASPTAIEKKLEVLARLLPDVHRPLAQLSIIVEGQQILLRQGEGLVEPGGQLRIDFNALGESQPPESADSGELILSLDIRTTESASPEDLVEYAAELEDEGFLAAASETYRAALSAGGPSAGVCFQLAEVLYRLGDITAARERYYMAIELDEDYVEARANLGCVLAETGQLELAVAAFQGALEYHEDYLDAHYHLARAYDELESREEAERHWSIFLDLAPEGPWAEEARLRLGDWS